MGARRVVPVLLGLVMMPLGAAALIAALMLVWAQPLGQTVLAACALNLPVCVGCAESSAASSCGACPHAPKTDASAIPLTTINDLVN